MVIYACQILCCVCVTSECLTLCCSGEGGAEATSRHHCTHVGGQQRTNDSLRPEVLRHGLISHSSEPMELLASVSALYCIRVRIFSSLTAAVG